MHPCLTKRSASILFYCMGPNGEGTALAVRTPPQTSSATTCEVVPRSHASVMRKQLIGGLEKKISYDY